MKQEMVSFVLNGDIMVWEGIFWTIWEYFIFWYIFLLYPHAG